MDFLILLIDTRLVRVFLFMEKLPEFLQKFGMGATLSTFGAAVVSNPQLFVAVVGVVGGLTIQYLGVRWRHALDKKFKQDQLEIMRSGLSDDVG